MSNYHCMNLETLTPNIQISKSLLQRGLFIHWALTPNWERNILFLFSVTKIHFCVPATTTTAATVSISCFFFPNKYWMCCAATTVTEEMPGRHGKMDGRGSCSRWWRSLQTYTRKLQETIENLRNCGMSVVRFWPYLNTTELPGVALGNISNG